MQRCFLTPLVIAGLLFLPSCSNAEEKLCEAAENARALYFSEFEADAKKFGAEVKSELALSGKAINPKIDELIESAVANEKKSYQVVINNQQCFTPTQVVEAQTKLEASK